MGQQRAHGLDEKQARRTLFLDAAGQLFDESGFAAVAMTAVAERAGLAKGTLYLYFDTKESLFLGVLEREYTGFFEALDAKLSGEDAPRKPKKMAQYLASELVARPRFTQLLALLHGVLEQNIGEERARGFKKSLIDNTTRTGALLEARLRDLPVGGGVRALQQLQALVIGLQAIAHPAAVVAKVLAEPGFAPLRVDFERELSSLWPPVLAALCDTDDRETA